LPNFGLIKKYKYFHESNRDMPSWKDFSREIILSVVMVFSAAGLVYKWLSAFDRLDAVIVFLAALLIASLAMFLVSIELRMQAIAEEFQNVKRTIAITSDELERRIATAIRPELRELAEKIDSIQRKMFR
ncbi:MAG: hypothetical protein QXQ49_00265, partial [Archaeoglobaceae archaeon]